MRQWGNGQWAIRHLLAYRARVPEDKRCIASLPHCLIAPLTTSLNVAHEPDRRPVRPGRDLSSGAGGADQREAAPGLTAEAVSIGAVRMDEPSGTGSSSIASRTTSRSIAPTSRTRRWRARPSSTTRSGGARTTSSSTTRSRRGSAWRFRRRCCCRTRCTRPGRTTSRCAISGTRSIWDEVFAYVGFPAFLKPFDGGGWRDVYKVGHRRSSSPRTTSTRDLCMTLQRA